MTEVDGRTGSLLVNKLNFTSTVIQTDSYPKFHNAPGAAIVRIGCREFKCIGDLPPQDHPHVYLNMGNANEIVCPYCATPFQFDSSVGPREAVPAACAYSEVDFEEWVRKTNRSASRSQVS